MVNSLMGNMLSKLVATLAKMAFRSTVYWIWRAKNGRRHHQTPNPPLFLAHTIHKEIQNRLLARRRGVNEEKEADDGLNRWIDVSRLLT